MKPRSRLLLAAALAALCGCDLMLPWSSAGEAPGGGGGRGPGAFTLGSSSVSFQGYQGALPPPMQSIPMRITGTGVAFAGTRNETGSLPVTWLMTQVRGTGTDLLVDVSIVDTGLPAGTHTTSFTVATYDSGGILLARKDVAVSFTVEEHLSIAGVSYRNTYTFGDGQVERFVVPVVAPGKTWAVTADVAWLQAPAGTRSGTGSVEIALDPSSLDSGTHAGRVTVANTARAGDTASFPVEITVLTPTLEVVGGSSLVLGGADGGSPPHATVQIRLGTASSHPYTVTPVTDDGASWLSVSPASGTVNATGVTLTVDGNRNAVQPGTWTGKLRIAATVGVLEVTRDLAVTFNRGSLRLWADSRGVGFSSTPARSMLSRTLKLYDSLGLGTVPWTAQSDQAWLTVTPSGTTSQPLALTANPAGLAAGTHLATVTVTSPDTGGPETIRIGLYVTEAAPGTVSVATAGYSPVASPVEPLVFISDGVKTVTARNVFTGEVERTFTVDLSVTGPMAMSGDGRKLFVYAPYANPPEVLEVDAVTGAQGRRFSSAAYNGGGWTTGYAVAYLQPSGHPMVITPSSRAYDLETGREYTDPGLTSFQGAQTATATGDGRRLVSDAGVVWRIGRSELGGGSLTGTFELGLPTSGRAGQACIRADGKVGYAASGGIYEFQGTDLDTHLVVQHLAGVAYPTAIVCPWNGLVVGASDAYYDPVNVFVHDGYSGASLGGLSSSTWTSYRNTWPGSLVVSADGTRLVSVASGTYSGSQVLFQPLPAPP